VEVRAIPCPQERDPGAARERAVRPEARDEHLASVARHERVRGAAIGAAEGSAILVEVAWIAGAERRAGADREAASAARERGGGAGVGGRCERGLDARSGRARRGAAGEGGGEDPRAGHGRIIRSMVTNPGHLGVDLRFR
jgi:hypothetical protein